MKNTLYDINDLYQATRRYYMKTFPYAGESYSANILNNELKWHSSKAEIIRADDFGNTKFENPEPIEETGSVYGESYGRTLEQYLSNDASRRDILDDLKAIREWMVKADFLYAESRGLLATEKLLMVKKITP